jgi:hypothetical protein
MNADTVRTWDLVQRAGAKLHALWLATENTDSAGVGKVRDDALDVLEEIENANVERVAHLLPAWFVRHMSTAVGRFGLLLATGNVLLVEMVLDVTQAADGALWLDVRLARHDPGDTQPIGWPACVGSPTPHATCSVAVAHVVCAVDLGDTWVDLRDT